MISKKDLSDAEMDTLTNSCSPTIVITANGEVQTQEEATVYVKELDIFLTMKVLENMPAVVSLARVYFLLFVTTLLCFHFSSDAHVAQRCVMDSF